MNLLEGFPVVIEIPVKWGEMDAFQHLNNTVYFRYFEDGRIEYVRRLDWFAYQEETGIGPILAAIEARFRKPVTYPDTVSVGTRIASLAEDRFTMEHLIVSHRLQAVAAEGKGTIVCYNYHEGKKAPIPEEFRRRIAELEGRAFV